MLNWVYLAISWLQLCHFLAGGAAVLKAHQRRDKGINTTQSRNDAPFQDQSVLTSPFISQTEVVLTNASVLNSSDAKPFDVLDNGTSTSSQFQSSSLQASTPGFQKEYFSTEGNLDSWETSQSQQQVTNSTFTPTPVTFLDLFNRRSLTVSSSRKPAPRIQPQLSHEGDKNGWSPSELFPSPTTIAPRVAVDALVGDGGVLKSQEGPSSPPNIVDWPSVLSEDTARSFQQQVLPPNTTVTPNVTSPGQDPTVTDDDWHRRVVTWSVLGVLIMVMASVMGWMLYDNRRRRLNRRRLIPPLDDRSEPDVHFRNESKTAQDGMP